MLTLDTLNVLLTIGEETIIEDLIIALLASPQLVVFLKNSPGLKTR
nr:hypothetical protein [Phytobacter massiliensis]